MRDQNLRLLADDIADALFTNGFGEKAQRLVLTVDWPKGGTLGGWSRAAVVNVVMVALEREREALTR